MELSLRYRKLNKAWYIVFVVFSAAALLIAVNHLFHLNLFGIVVLDSIYYYLLLGLYASVLFILIPATKKSSRERVPWYDLVLFMLTVWCCGYFASQGRNIVYAAWSVESPLVPTVLSFLLCALVLEATRRVGGFIVAGLCLFFFFLPMITSHLPGLLQGIQYSPAKVARAFAMGTDGILGIALSVTLEIVIGFMVYGAALVATGGGKFFLNVAFALFGSVRGGPAKVAVISSALFGSVSGSSMANVIATGSVTIPTMKKTGYPAYFAAAVEACASTGGMLMPPVMGAVAFLMASFLGIPYAKVCIAAIIPSLLYYLSLYVQVDARAVTLGLKGVPRNEVPPLKQTLKEGWPYIFSFVALIVLLFWVRVEVWAPFYASALLIIAAMFRKETRLDLRRFADLIADIGKIMAEMTGILAGIGLIIGAFGMTGIAFSFSQGLVRLAGGSVIALLFMSALTCFILGMGMIAPAVYVFVVIVVAPALVQLGLNIIAVHLFVLYWGILSAITPPVCLTAYCAASIAETDPWKTGFASTRLGVILYVIPFLFVYDPALVLQVPLVNAVIPIITCTLGVWLIASAAEGFLVIMRKLTIFERILLFVAGVLLGLPGYLFDSAGLIMVIITVLFHLFVTKKLKKKTKQIM